MKKRIHQENQTVCPALHHYEIRSTLTFVDYVKKKRVQHRNKRNIPCKITRFDTVSRIKSAAKINNPALYNEIVDLNLIAKEFEAHKHCYKKFTLKPVENAKIASDANSSLDHESSTCYLKSNYEEPKKYVRDVMIKEKQPASMKFLHDIYGLGTGNLSYRHKLKTRLQTDFGDGITFLSQKIKH